MCAARCRAEQMASSRLIVGQRVARLFQGAWFAGVVAASLPPDDEPGSSTANGNDSGCSQEHWLFHVTYDDGDEEDLGALLVRVHGGGELARVRHTCAQRWRSAERIITL